MTPGNRLIRARRLNQFRTRTDFHDHLINSNHPIDYARLGRLERDEDSPTIGEVDIFCSTLDMTADYYLRGVAPSVTTLLNRVDNLKPQEQMLALLFIDALRFR